MRIVPEFESTWPAGRGALVLLHTTVSTRGLEQIRETGMPANSDVGPSIIGGDGAVNTKIIYSM